MKNQNKTSKAKKTSNSSGSVDLGEIYYDGLCKVCSAEIEHYKKQTGAHRFVFVDITHGSFDAKKAGLDPFQVHKVMHVRSPDGNIHTKVDAFRAIWKELPKYQWLYKLSGVTPIRKSMDLGYIAFSKIRPYLPRKSADCSQSPYCELKA